MRSLRSVGARTTFGGLLTVLSFTWVFSTQANSPPPPGTAAPGPSKDPRAFASMVARGPAHGTRRVPVRRSSAGQDRHGTRSECLWRTPESPVEKTGAAKSPRPPVASGVIPGRGERGGLAQSAIPCPRAHGRKPYQGRGAPLSLASARPWRVRPGRSTVAPINLGKEPPCLSLKPQARPRRPVASRPPMPS